MRQVRIACVLQSKFIHGRPNESLARREDCIAEALGLLTEACSKGVDIAVLGESFCDSTGPDGVVFEPIDGPTVAAVARIAAAGQIYVIAPISELATDGTRFNTAIVVDRSGSVIGRYCKNIPFWSEEGVTPGCERCVFDLDFGRIGISICFESNWPDVWCDYGEQGAEIVFWPSAYTGGRKLTAAAIYNNFYVVSCTVIRPDTTLVDITGDVIAYAAGAGQVVVHEVDLDRTLVHDNFNGEKLAQIRRDYGDRIKMQYLAKEGWWLVESTDVTTAVRSVLKERRVETLQEYTQRSRREIYALREKGLPLPKCCG